MSQGRVMVEVVERKTGRQADHDTIWESMIVCHMIYVDSTMPNWKEMLGFCLQAHQRLLGFVSKT